MNTQRNPTAEQELQTQLFKITALGLLYRRAEAEHTKQQSAASWKAKEETANFYEQEMQWFSERNLLPVWNKDMQRFDTAQPLTRLAENRQDI